MLLWLLLKRKYGLQIIETVMKNKPLLLRITVHSSEKKLENMQCFF